MGNTMNGGAAGPDDLAANGIDDLQFAEFDEESSSDDDILLSSNVKKTMPVHMALRQREIGRMRRGRTDWFENILQKGATGTLNDKNEKMLRHVQWLKSITASVLKGEQRAQLAHSCQRLMGCFPHDEADTSEKNALAFIRLGGLEALFDTLIKLHATIVRNIENHRGADDTRTQRTLLSTRHMLIEVASMLLVILREVLHTIGEARSVNEWYCSQEAIAVPLRFLMFPGLANTASFAADELLARLGKILPLSTLELMNLDLPSILYGLSPKDFSSSTHILAFLAFDALAQDPSKPSNVRKLLRRARDTATHVPDVVVWDDSSKKFREMPPSVRRCTPSPFVVSISPEVDDNHAAVITLEEGLLLRRLLLLLAAPDAPERFKRAAALAEQLQQGDQRVVLNALIEEPQLLAALQQMSALAEADPRAWESIGTPGEVRELQIQPSTTATTAVADVTTVLDVPLSLYHAGALYARETGSKAAKSLPISARSKDLWARLEQLASKYLVVSHDPLNDRSGTRVPSRCVFSHFDVMRSVYDHHWSRDIAHITTTSMTTPPTISAAAEAASSDATSRKDIFTDADLPRSAPRHATTARVQFSRASSSTAAPDDVDPFLAVALTQISLQKTEITFALCAHMSGGRRRQLQDFLVANGVLPLLAHLFSKANWLYDPGSSPPPRIHGPTCQCRPETAGTIQIMRLFYSIMDRDCDSPVQRWFPRRRMLLQDEITHIFSEYAQTKRIKLDQCFAQAAWAQAWAARVDSLLSTHSSSADVDPASSGSTRQHHTGSAEQCQPNEISLLALMTKTAACRPWAWVSKPINVAPAVTAASSVGATTTDTSYACMRLCDPVIAGRNAQGVKPFDVDDVDSGDDTSTTAPAKAFVFHPPRSDLIIDPICHATRERDDADEALAKAMSTADVGAWSPELVPRPRGIVSLALHVLVLSSKKSPYRGWLSSCVETFLRGAPEPARRWACAHGIVRYLVRVLLDDFASSTIRTTHALLNAEDVETARAAASRKRENANNHRRTQGIYPSLNASDDESVDGDNNNDDSHSKADSDHSCDEEELSARYSLQSMFDLLGECIRSNPMGLQQLFAFDVEWTSSVLPQMAPELHASAGRVDVEWTSSVLPQMAPELHASAGMPWKCADDVETRQVVQGTTLLRLAFDRLTDGNVLVRDLLLAEDVAYGMCERFERLHGCSPPVKLEDAPWKHHIWSWEALHKRSMELLAPASTPAAGAWYATTDAATLMSPTVAMLRDYRVPLTYQFMASQTLHSITHETICCINATLLSFVVAHRHGALPGFIAALKEYDVQFGRWAKSLHSTDTADVSVAAESTTPLLLPSLSDAFFNGIRVVTGPTPANAAAVERWKGDSPGVFDCFRHVCRFWMEYYSMRERDRRSLRIIYGYAYEEWRVVVRALLGLEPTSNATAPILPLEEVGTHPLRVTKRQPLPTFVADSAMAETEAAATILQAWMQEPFVESAHKGKYWDLCRL